MEKKNLYRILFLFIITNITLYLHGCASVEQTLYLGDVKVNAPISTPPTHININKEPGDVTISPRFALINKKKVTGSTEDRHTQSLLLLDSSEYKPKSNNVEWNFSRYIFGTDIDFKLSKAFSLFGGFSFSSEGNLWGGNLGIGLHSHSTSPVVRFDIGINIQKYEYDAVTIVHTRESYFGEDADEYISFFHDKGNEINFNPFFSLTVNSTNDSSLLNYFMSAGFFWQSLLDFEPGETNYDPFLFWTKTVTDMRPDCNSGFLFFNPGLNLNLNEHMRILFSAKVLKEVLVTSDSNEWLVVPSVQLDFQL